MISTEKRNERTTHLDTMSTSEFVSAMSMANRTACQAVEAAEKQIADAIDMIYPKMAQGGRLFYIGSGTSGRLGVLDASECPPTFGVSPDLVVGIIAGGDGALRRSSEAAEDSYEDGILDLKKHGLSPADSVVGISASGNSQYLIGAMTYAREIGCVTVGLTCNADARIIPLSDCPIITDTGAEVLTGSTRLKAGTAHKLVLNALSTGLMIKCGYIYENLMINLKPTNIKLRNRMISITSDLAGVDAAAAEQALEQSGWDIRKALEKITGTVI